jgi:hypothetical protein
VTDQRDESVAELLGDLSKQITTLVQQELALAKAELGQKGRRVGTGAGLFGGAGIVAVLGLGVLAAAAVAGLANLLTVWAAALIVGGVLLAVAGMLALIGKNEVTAGVPPTPTQTVASSKEDVAWLKTQVTSAKP